MTARVTPVTRLEPDNDIHVVVTSGGSQMIVEIPNPGCVGTSSPFYYKAQAARNAFISKYSPTSTMKSFSDYITILGVGFWDYNHGQTSVAPNAIERHPVTFFCSGYNC
jgi:hypothetical protein